MFLCFIGINKFFFVVDVKGDEEEKEVFFVFRDVVEGVEDDFVFDFEFGSDLEVCDDGFEVEIEYLNKGKVKKIRG